AGGPTCGYGADGGPFGDVQVPVGGIDSGMQRAAASQAPGPVADGKVPSIRSIEKGASEGPSVSAVAAGGAAGTTAPGDPATTDESTPTGTPTTGGATPTVDPTTTEATEPGTSSPSPTASDSQPETPTPYVTDSGTGSNTAEPTPTETTATPSESGRWLKPVKGSKSRDLTASPSPTVQVSASPTENNLVTSVAEESVGSGPSGTSTATDTATATTTIPAA
ncbi:hypothetical protein ACKAE7_15525, partial [Pseudarthrobacter sp. NKDBFgelt]